MCRYTSYRKYPCLNYLYLRLYHQIIVIWAVLEIEFNIKIKRINLPLWRFVQVFRSIDSNSVKGFPKDPRASAERVS